MPPAQVFRMCFDIIGLLDDEFTSALLGMQERQKGMEV